MKTLTAKIFSCVLAGSFSLSLFLAAQPVLADCPAITTAPASLPDGAWGFNYTQTDWTKTWTRTGAMNQPGGTPVLLADGRVWVNGGDNEIYNPATGSWKTSAPMSTSRNDYVQVLLANGQLMVAGGEGLASVELYDPVGDAWAYTTDMPVTLRAASAVLLKNGKVLVAGGINDDGTSTNCYLYDPIHATWTRTGSLHSPRWSSVLTLLPNGTVMLFSGYSHNTMGGMDTSSSAVAEIYDPATGSWTINGEYSDSVGLDSVTLLKDGRVLVAGGNNYGDEVDIFDPAAGTWTPVASLNTARWGSTAALLDNGQVLVTGGNDEFGHHIDSSELFDPVSGIWSPAAGTTNGGLLVTLKNGLVLMLDATAPQLYGAVALAAAGGAAPYTYAVSDGVLPPGLVLATNGILTGVTLTNGAYTFTVTATDAAGCSGNSVLSLSVKQPASVVLSGLNQESDGAAKTVTVTTDPAGLTVDVFYNGSPTAPASVGAYNVLAVIRDSNYTGFATGILNVNCQPDSSGVIPLPDAVLGFDYTATSPFNIGGAIPTSPMLTMRSADTTTLLPNGKVLVTGGLNYSVSNDISVVQGPFATAEVYDPTIGEWPATGSMLTPRYGHAATLLANGKVLVTGGNAVYLNGGITYQSSLELYDPATGAWQTAPLSSMHLTRMSHTATLLPDGRVLVAGGTGNHGVSTATAEIYDSAADTWTMTGSMNAVRAGHTAILLKNGKVLVLGGGTANPEIYDPATSAWTSTSPANIASSGFAAVGLNDGRVLVTGGSSSQNDNKTAYLYDPATDIWSATAPLLHALSSHTATLLPDGRVLVAGGMTIGTEIFDPVTTSWTGGNNLLAWRLGPVATLLQDGTVLIRGGALGSESLPNPPDAEIYRFPTGTPPYAYFAAAPNGLSLDPYGVISGKPLALGTNIFTVNRTDANGASECFTYRIVTVPSGDTSDIRPPVVAIVSPKNNTTTTSQFITINGTAGDSPGIMPGVVTITTNFGVISITTNGLGQTITNAGIIITTNTGPPIVSPVSGVAEVLYSLNSGPQQLARTANQFAKWNATVALSSGWNNFSVQSVDHRGNVSPPVTYYYFYKSYMSLSVRTTGLGTTSLPDGSKLAGGTTNTIVAKPGRNHVFSHWTDHAGRMLTNAASYKFVMHTNLVLVANFITNPVVAMHLNGAYNGLFAESSGVTERSAGFISALALTTNRTFTGKLFLQGGSYSVAGTFDLSGHAHTTVARAAGGLPSLDIAWMLNWDFPNDQITGTVSNMSNVDSWSAPLVANHSLYSAAHPYPSPAKYNLVLPSASASGIGYATMTNNAAGNSILSGKLSDAVTFSRTVPVSKDGYIPVYADLYAHQGLLHGWLNLGPGAPAGVLTWVCPPNQSSVHPAGFTNTINVNSSVYTIPAAGLPAITLADGLLDLTLDDGSPLTFNVALDHRTNIVKVGNTPTNTMSGSYDLKTGILKLKFKPSATVTNLGFGIVLPSSNSAWGALPGATNIGSIYLH